MEVSSRSTSTTLRAQLYLLALGAVLPIALLALAGGMLLVSQEKTTMETEAVGRARATMSAVDADLKGHIQTVQALAASRSLDSGDLKSFYDEARRALATQPRC